MISATFLGSDPPRYSVAENLSGADDFVGYPGARTLPLRGLGHTGTLSLISSPPERDSPPGSLIVEHPQHPTTVGMFSLCL